MFRNLTLNGGRASILWGYRTAAELKSWTITKKQDDPTWTLVGVVLRVDSFQARQKPLLFTAPRTGAHDGFWAFPIIGDLHVGTSQLVATIGAPEQ